MGENLRKYSAIMGAALIFGIGAASLPVVATAGPIDDAVAAAMKDVEQGRCEQAYRRLAAIEGLESRARLLSGQCRIRAGLYPEALDDLDRARGDDSLTPAQVGDVELYRGVALYHLERYTEASAAFDNADGLTREDAQLALYRGLIALREGDNDRAAPALETAARLSPRMTEPVASYYAGLAWQGASERTKAREAFQRVIDIDGDGPWGQEARKLLGSTELFPFYARLSAGVEYDSNVLLRGDNVTEAPVGTRLTQAGERSWRGVWEAEAGVELFRASDWSGGITGSYFGNAHTDVDELDTHYPTVGGYLARRLGPNTVAQALYQFGHAWVNEDPYLRSHFGELSLAHTWERAGTTIFALNVLENDLRFNPLDVPDAIGGTCPPGTTIGCSPPGVDEVEERNRDGLGYGGAIEHRVLVPVPGAIDRVFEQVELGGAYRFLYYDSEGQEWEHFSHIFSTGIEIELPLDFSVASRLSYEYRDFQNPSTFPDSETVGLPYTLSNSDRQEHEVTFEGELEKDITANFSVSARYSYLNNESNRDVYDYDRHIVGGFVNFRFD